MTEVPRCKGLFGWHRFEARYDEVPEHAEKLGNEAQMIRAFFQNIGAHRKYVHDICTKCGHVIKRTASTPAPGA